MQISIPKGYIFNIVCCILMSFINNFIILYFQDILNNIIEFAFKSNGRKENSSIYFTVNRTKGTRLITNSKKLRSSF